MRQFFKFMFATIAGIFVSTILLVLITIGLVASLASSDEHKEEVKSNSILQISLDYMITERSAKNSFEGIELFSDESEKKCGLNDLVKSIRYAAEDEKIKGIYLNLSISPNSYATLEEVRDALLDFKKSKKFIVAYGEVMEEHSYYLASVADKIYLNPSGELLINGFSYSEPYLKNMFEKIGVEPILIRHGKYKSAGEPLIADKMSEENKHQIEVYAGGIYDHFIDNVAKSRKKTFAQVKEISNKLLIQCPEDALKQGMIDKIVYEDEVMDELKKLTNTKEKDKLSFVNPGAYAKTAKDKSNITSKNKVAVIYATGDIVSGESDNETCGSATLAESISKARKDSAVKVIILRVNSPGGSALASDVIWREIELAKKSKPVIASFGAVAASGGYYIAASANSIVAEPNTVTGSIGVFGLLFNAQKLLTDKLGINFQTVKSGQYSDIGSPDRPMTADEREIIQKGVDRIYNDFVLRVANGRKLEIAKVDSIAQGRVWTGTDAKNLGLVDEIGGMDKALEVALKAAKITDYRIVNYPEQKSPFENILKNMGDKASLYFTQKQLGENYKYYEMVRKVQRYQGTQLRLLDAEIN